MVVATWKNHADNLTFNVNYKTRGGFLRAVTRTKHASLEHAVDDKLVVVIRMSSLEQYKEMK